MLHGRPTDPPITGDIWLDCRSSAGGPNSYSSPPEPHTCAEALHIQLPPGCSPDCIQPQRASGLDRVLTVWRHCRPEALRPTLAALVVDEALRGRADALMRMQPLKGPLRKVAAALHAAHGGRHTLCQMAAAACLTPYHFSRLFKMTVGVPPGQFIKRQQLLIGLDLLVSSTSTVSQIACRLDMTVAHFSHQFSAHYGIAPRRLRALVTAVAIPERDAWTRRSAPRMPFKSNPGHARDMIFALSPTEPLSIPCSSIRDSDAICQRH